MTRCPEGHDSSTADYCDVCGMPMSARPVSPAPTAPPAPDPGPTPADDSPPDVGVVTQTCPHCSAVNAEDNLFCEVCGFDFTTGVMPRVEGGAPAFLPAVVVPDDTDDQRSDDEGSGNEVGGNEGNGNEGNGNEVSGDEVGSNADDNHQGSDGQGNNDQDDNGHGNDQGNDDEGSDDDVSDGGREIDSTAREVDSLDATTPDPVGPPPASESHAGARGGPASAAASSTPAADPVRTAPKPVNRPPSREVAGDWVVEVWIDPDWYAVQDTDEPCPSPAPPEIVRITGSDALVGRRSRSSVPDVDCGVDSAVSRRQALLTSDGRRWWIEDLDSSNGTWVAPAIGPLPTSPISARTEIDADDRVYVGAWTRLVLRPATDTEVSDSS